MSGRNWIGPSGRVGGGETSAAVTADSQPLLLDRLDDLAAKQDEIRAMLIELQRPPASS